MKKILISLGIIGAVAVIAIGATVALFSDTETSAGNILTAGALDLKVDHKYAMYNGNPCKKNCVENKSINLIQNGSFEVPEVTHNDKWQIFPSGTTGLEWIVEWAGNQTVYQNRTRPEPALVEYHEGVQNLGSAQDGDQYAELDSDWFGPNDPLNGEPALIKIYQNISTVPGEKYKLRYYFRPRPNTGQNENILYVKINGVQVQQQGQVAGGGTTTWTEYTLEFIATSSTTKIEFVGGGNDNSVGVFLDNVRVHPYNCTYQITGGTCTLWEEKDLGEGDYYWNFEDVKPGDYGVNVISLHAYNNDANACLFTSVIDDQENGLTEPELEAQDPGAPQGELSQFIKVFAWEDDGDGVYEGETIITGPNEPLNTKNIQLALTASTTKNIGLAWCAGTQSLNNNNIVCNGSSMGNIAQSDVMIAALTAYAEQQRNNPNFSCANVVLPTPTPTPTLTPTPTP